MIPPGFVSDCWCGVPLAMAIDDILIIAAHSLEDEWFGQVRYLPLR